MYAASMSNNDGVVDDLIAAASAAACFVLFCIRHEGHGSAKAGTAVYAASTAANDGDDEKYIGCSSCGGANRCGWCPGTTTCGPDRTPSFCSNLAGSGEMSEPPAVCSGIGAWWPSVSERGNLARAADVTH